MDDEEFQPVYLGCLAFIVLAMGYMMGGNSVLVGFLTWLGVM